MAVSGNLEGKVPVVDNVWSSHEQSSYHTTTLNENCIEFEFQTNQNYYVDLRQTYLALKLKFVKDRGYEKLTIAEKFKKGAEEDAKAAEEVTAEEEQDAPVLLFTHEKNILHSIFSQFQVYINNQQIYNFNEIYAHSSYNSNSFKGAISE